MKTCSKCKIEKPLNEFGKHRNSKSGLQAYCRGCKSIYTKDRAALLSEERSLRSQDLSVQKECAKCKVLVPLEKYSVQNANADGRARVCKTCSNDYSREWRKRNLDRIRAAEKERSKTPSRIQSRASWSKRYKAENPQAIAAYTSLYRARKIQCAGLLNEEHKAQIRELHKARRIISSETGILHHVDHIIPLRGKNVCGLHVPWNLQIIPAEENLKKGNRLNGTPYTTTPYLAHCGYDRQGP